jgi:hypothetical protein
MLGCLAPFRTQLVGKRDSRWHDSPNPFLGTPKSALHGRDAQFAVLHAHIQNAANVHPERLADGGWNDNPPLFSYSRSSMKLHVAQSPLVTLFYLSATIRASVTRAV